MKALDTTTHETHHKEHQHPAHERAATDRTLLGFWLYIMSDCLIFASLFATYAVLRMETFGGPSAKDIISLPYVLVETILLLTSSFTCGLAILSVHTKSVRATAAWFMVTLALGVSFLAMELVEFRSLILEGHGPSASAFLSSYFTLLGTHGLHVALGSIWMMVLIVMVLTRGLTEQMKRRFLILSLFWHFLDIIWVFIFTFVYLMGAL